MRQLHLAVHRPPPVQSRGDPQPQPRQYHHHHHTRATAPPRCAVPCARSHTHTHSLLLGGLHRRGCTTCWAPRPTRCWVRSTFTCCRRSGSSSSAATTHQTLCCGKSAWLLLLRARAWVQGACGVLPGSFSGSGAHACRQPQTTAVHTPVQPTVRACPACLLAVCRRLGGGNFGVTYEAVRVQVGCWPPPAGVVPAKPRGAPCVGATRGGGRL
jgi:hypothetical protein